MGNGEVANLLDRVRLIVLRGSRIELNQITENEEEGSKVLR